MACLLSTPPCIWLEQAAAVQGWPLQIRIALAGSPDMEPSLSPPPLPHPHPMPGGHGLRRGVALAPGVVGALLGIRGARGPLDSCSLTCAEGTCSLVADAVAPGTVSLETPAGRSTLLLQEEEEEPLRQVA